jgi:uncharacterized protein (UPF0332 family)
VICNLQFAIVGDRKNAESHQTCCNPSVARTWLELAREARNAANGLLIQEQFRSCMSRAYYAAYSKVTHELVFTAQLTMPVDREGPHHTGHRGAIRPMIETSMPNMQQEKRVKLSELIGPLYTLRIDADYRPSVDVGARDAREAVTIMKRVFESF